MPTLYSAKNATFPHVFCYIFLYRLDYLFFSFSFPLSITYNVLPSSIVVERIIFDADYPHGPPRN